MLTPFPWFCPILFIGPKKNSFILSGVALKTLSFFELLVSIISMFTAGEDIRWLVDVIDGSSHSSALIRAVCTLWFTKEVIDGSSHWTASILPSLTLLLTNEVISGSSELSASIVPSLTLLLANETIVGSSNLSASITPIALLGFNWGVSFILRPILDLNNVSFLIS